MTEHIEDRSYERKIAIEGVPLSHVESLVRLHPLGFRDLYPERWINNLYLDTTDFAAYRSNEGGVGERVKYRVRWYGELLGRVPALCLELKHKTGWLRRKLVYPIPGVELTKGLGPALESVLQASLPGEIREELQLLRPVLLNRYARRYYRSSCGRFRLTLDREVGFYGLSGPGMAPTRQVASMPGTILEVKYARADDDAALAMIGEFPFRLTKHSKYVVGVERLYDAGLLRGPALIPLHC